ncbi:MAG: hypothetical protein ACTSWL_05595, partial [Promethearchaeota archaeon]
MGSKKEKVKSGTISDFHKKLNSIQDQIQNATKTEDLENAKRSLIKLYDFLKQSPSLLKFDEERLHILRICNQNLQLLHREEDAWMLVKQGKAIEAYDDILQTNKACHLLAQQTTIQDWIQN